MKKILIPALFALLFTACNREPHFRVEGAVADAAGEQLFLEAVEPDSVRLVASLELPENGEFSFTEKAPATPEFYRLRLNGTSLNFAVDSTETVTIRTQKWNFGADYTIGDSESNEAIRQLARSAADVKRLLNKLQAEEPAGEETSRELLEAVAAYKELARSVIRKDPKSAAAYFALFQQVNNMVICDIDTDEDFPYFSAVATAWDAYYPESERTKRLYAGTLAALQAQRNRKKPAEKEIVPDEVGYLEIALPNRWGKEISLSSLVGKQAVLLNFTMYKAPYSAAFNRQLAAIYEQYASRGLEILQVSVDTEENFWKNTAVNLPWITVIENTLDASSAKRYQVTRLPTSFLIDKGGNIVKRIEDHAELEQAVKALL